MDKYKAYLADRVISEDNFVTYRQLSRSLGVHLNTAKQMLYDFHKGQNDRRPGSIHATYLVYGLKVSVPQPSNNSSDGDIEMASSPPYSSPPYADSVVDTVSAYTLALIPEERLQDELAEYAEVVSIQVYSIEPGPMKHLALLTGAAEEVLGEFDSDDFKKPDVIVNPRLRRRERTRAPLKTATAGAGSSKTVKTEQKPAFSAAAAKPAPAAAKAKEAPKPAATEKASVTLTSKKAPPPLKRGGSSNAGGIMAAFSKVAAKAASNPKKGANASGGATPSGDDSSIHPMSDDGEDDGEMPQPKPRETAGRKTKKQREEELRRMMEEDDEEEEEQEQEKAATPEEEEEPVEEPAVPEPHKEEPSEVVTTSGNGRRRGKRRIMRKKQIMDEQGYLVTIQEPGWESFSEDEAPPKSKPKITAAPAAAKPKKPLPKGQGSITSFFSKN